MNQDSNSGPALSRRGLLAAVPPVAIARRPARAAEFAYKSATGRGAATSVATA